MSVATSKPRRRYQFSDRGTADREYHAASIQSLRAYHVAMAYRSGESLARFECGNYSAELVIYHATTGRPLSMGPIAVVASSAEYAAGPEIVDAYDWAHRNGSEAPTPSDDDGFAYRQLAYDVMAFITNHKL